MQKEEHLESHILIPIQKENLSNIIARITHETILSIINFNYLRTEI